MPISANSTKYFTFKTCSCYAVLQVNLDTSVHLFQKGEGKILKCILKESVPKVHTVKAYI